MNVKTILNKISENIFLGYANPYDYEFIYFLRKEIKIHGDVLDVGCGNGRLLKKLSPHINRGVGVDLIVNPSRTKNLTFIRKNISKLNHVKSKFDFVICTDVIEHINNDKKLVRDMVNRLKQGGILIIKTPNSAALENIKPAYKILKQQGHVRLGYTLKDMRKISSRFKLKIIKYFSIHKGILDEIPYYLYSRIQKNILDLTFNPLWRFFSIVTFIYDKISTKEGKDMIVVMKKL